MKIDTTITTHKTVWVHLDADELHRIIAQAVSRAAGLRAGVECATVHFADDAPRSAPSRRTMRASVELVLSSEKPRPTRHKQIGN